MADKREGETDLFRIFLQYVKLLEKSGVPFDEMAVVSRVLCAMMDQWTGPSQFPLQ